MNFDDFLGLDGRDFSRYRMVVFVGRSGSGKSTAIRFLHGRYPSFGVIDELRSPRDLARLVRPLREGARLLVASHVAAGWFEPLRALVPVALFRTDRDEGKIARYLGALGVSASAEAVQAYVRCFGATYTDVDIILERFPCRSFDRALGLFKRFCALSAR